jgi:hypothetical protein
MGGVGWATKFIFKKCPDGVYKVYDRNRPDSFLGVVWRDTEHGEHWLASPNIGIWAHTRESAAADLLENRRDNLNRLRAGFPAEGADDEGEPDQARGRADHAEGVVDGA